MTRSIKIGPWTYFLVFCAMNAFIAYGPGSLLVKLAAVLLGVALPFFLYLRSSPRKEDPAAGWGSPGPETPLWVFLLFLILGLLLRIATGETLSHWPIWDDAVSGYFAIQRMDHWDWELWYHGERVPALSIWLQGLFFRVLPPSLFSLWLFPALESSLALLLSYWACRQYASRPFAFLFTCLLAVGFWPVYFSHFSVPPQIGLVWEPLVIGLLGWYRKGGSGRQQVMTAFLFGALLAGGCFTWFFAPVLILFLLAAFFSARPPTDAPRAWVFLGFLLGFSIPAALLGPGMLENFRQGHIHDYSPLSGPSTPWERLKVPIDYVTSLLWGPWNGRYFCFGPLWGGFLNPILGALSLLGLAEWRHPGLRKPLGWVLAGSFLCLLPGLVSGNLEMFRIGLALPFAFFWAALGATRLARTSRRWPLLALCLALGSFFLDLYHLAGPYRQWAVPRADNAFFKSPERYRSFPILEEQARERGPGLILTQFVPNVSDQSLLVAAFPFNAAVNHHLDPSRSQWMAVLVAEYQKKYLEREFPGFRWHPLSDGLGRYDQSLYLGILPLTEGASRTFEPWRRLDSQLLGLYPRIPYGLAAPDYAPLESGLLPLHREYLKDPFLEACLREKIAYLEFSSGHFQEFLRLAQPILKSGWACGLMYRRAGAAAWTLGSKDKAAGYFKEAGRLNPLDKPPKGLLDGLGKP